MSLLVSSSSGAALLRPPIPDRESKIRSTIIVLYLLGLCGTLFFYGLSAGELYQTESLRAILATEFLRSGNWIVPTLYGEPLLTKPPGAYAAIALASWPSGSVSLMTARLPSTLAATATVFLFYAAFARRLGRRAGLIAATILPASVAWLQRVPSAEIDLLQLAWVTASLLCFLRALEIAEAHSSGRFGREWLWWQLALLCVAGGVLTKWTAPAFFYLTVVPLLWWRGQLRLLARPAHWLSVLMAAAPCLAWAAAAVSLTGWDNFHDTIAREALQRLSPAHHPRPYPWRELLTFPLQFLAANLPWSAFALLTLHPGFSRLWDERGRRLLQLLHCWTWTNLLFWTLVPGHRPRHSLPLQPGLAGLAALVWIAWFDGRLRWLLPRIRPSRVFLGLMVLWLAVKLIFVQVIVPSRNPTREPRAKGERIAALVPPGETLYLFRLKDEGILFYYNRPTRRLPSPSRLPVSGETRYCLFVESEWQQWCPSRRTEVLLRLTDEQGAALVLVKVG
jgi:4-amino-4-deoxy-L-arabinose transferase-like glycosyltransferase